ncbi:MAG: sulfoxide reductase heme-binding subunit YedZ [Cellvibrionaceae bacterium]|nr:sulfoxide reductase heme-binding subunit YedZ [Cellvibrionaceae bacterium]
MNRTVTRRHYKKAAVFGLLSLPAALLLYALLAQSLGTNPVEKLTHETGKWALICLCLSLAATPLRQLLRWVWLMQYRRMLGLFAFFYACLHLAVYWVFDQSLSFIYLWDDIKDRPYITMGFSAWLILLPLAITSTLAWRKRLGKNWLRLHRLSYAAVLIALLHYIWLIRADYSEVYPFAIAIAVLLGHRLVKQLQHRLYRPTQKA